MKGAVLGISLTLLTISIIALAFNMRSGEAKPTLALSTETQSNDILSAWAFKVPTIDGIIDSGEWDDASKVTATLVAQSLESHSATICEKNDATYMYLAVRVLGDDFHAMDGVFFNFDNNHDGNRQQGDDWLYVLAWTNGLGLAEDGYYNASRGSTSDVGDQGTNDIVGKASHTNISGMGDYTFELKHLLDSADDAHDFSLNPNDTVGVKMEYDDKNPGGAQASPWPASWQYADIVIVGAPSADMGGEVKFSGTAVTDEQWGDLVCYGSYYCSVQVLQILSDPNITLAIGDTVSISYNNSLSIRTGDSVECYGYYWKNGGPMQCIGKIECKNDGYYVIPEFSNIVLFLLITATSLAVVTRARRFWARAKSVLMIGLNNAYIT